MANGHRNIKLALYSIAGLITIWIIVLASYGYPEMQEDGVYYAGTAWNVANGRGLVNETYENHTGNLFISRPPLYPWITGALISIMPTSHAVYYALAFFEVTALWLMAWFLHRLSRRYPLPLSPRMTLVLLLACLAGFATLLDHSAGRPESLTRIFTLVALHLGLSYMGDRRSPIIGMIGIVVGITILTGLLPGLNLFLVSIAFLFLFVPARQVPWFVIGMILPAAVIIPLYPYSLAQLARSVLQASGEHFASVINIGFFEAIFRRKISALFLFQFFLSIACGFFLIRLKVGKSRKTALYLYWILFNGWLFYCGFFLATYLHDYQLMTMVPLFILVIYLAVSSGLLPLNRTAPVILAALLALPSVGLAKKTYEFVYYLKGGHRLEDAKTQVKRWVMDDLRPGEIIRIESSLWILFDDLRQVRNYFQPGMDPTYLVIRQDYWLYNKHPGPELFYPPNLDAWGYALLYDGYSREGYRYFGYAAVPGYNIAIYKKKNAG